MLVRVGMHVSIYLKGAEHFIYYCLGRALQIKSSPELPAIVMSYFRFVNYLKWDVLFYSVSV